MLSPRGVRTTTVDGTDSIELCVCADCHHSLRHSRMPTFAIANGLAVGQLPSDLCDLTRTELALVCTNAAYRLCAYIH